MVDTINPNTNEPDSLGEGAPTPPSNDGRFYGGFDKPDATKINLADAEATVPNEQPVVEPVSPPQPLGGVTPVKPAEVKHSSYVNTENMVNWRGIFVITVVGVLVALILGAGLYFGISSLNKSKIEEQEAILNDLNEEVSLLNEIPDPLELPEQVIETPAEEAPVVVPPVVTPTPTETEETEIPDSTNNIPQRG